MKLISSIQFILKFFLVIVIIITAKYLSRNVHRGFVCGDPALSLNKKPDTVTNVMLLAWGTAPLLILMISEMIFNYDSKEKVKVCVQKSWRTTAYLSHRYLVDVLLMHLLIQAAKFFTGAHRPHFFETCRPDRMINCTLGTFIPTYNCTNTELSRFQLADASMSFFSGHAATCVYSCFFVIWYIQKRVKVYSIFLIPLIQTSLICLSFYGSISRVFDHRHHWWDVLTGALVGLLTTYHTCYVLCKNDYAKPKSENLPTDNSSTFLATNTKATIEE